MRRERLACRASSSAARRGALGALVLLLAWCATLPVDATVNESPAERPLRATLERDLAAIDARDLDVLPATVTRGERLTTILPDAEVLATSEQYRQLHVDGFRETDWRMGFGIEEMCMTSDTGIVRVRYDAQVRGPDGAYASRRITRLPLIFAREDGEWSGLRPEHRRPARAH